MFDVHPSPRQLRLALGFLLASCVGSQAQPVTPVWEFFINQLPTPLPILTNAVPWTTDLDQGDGRSLLASIGPLRRFDANRLLLGIRENGIDESGGSGAYNTNLARAYPDRSLFWINPTNGQPMGVALTMGLYPVPLNPSLAAAGGTPGQYYWSFDVSDDGYVYSGYKNQILRYAPNGSGGIGSTPTVVFTLDQPTATANGVPADQWMSMRWTHIRVRGSGPNTTLLAGGVGTRGVWYLTTTDGVSFAAGAHINGSWSNPAGNISNIIPDPTGWTPGQIAFYGGCYPANSGGADSYLYKATAYPPFNSAANVFVPDGGFAAQPDANANNLSQYLCLFQGSCDAHPDLDFVVNYSTPPYQSPAVAPHQPAWLAIHNRTNGDFIASYELPFSDLDQYLTTDQSMPNMGCFGSVSLSPLPDGTAEVLWTSAIFGYGRYLIGSPRYTQVAAMTREIRTLWEQLDGSTRVPLAILSSHVDTNAPVHNDNTATMHMLTGLKRYDAQRLLLGIRDNGINETVSHNTNLAHQYPDRSLHWIDRETGRPLGTAVVVDYASLGFSDISAPNLQNMAFGVDDAGVVYVGVADKIMRYAPDASRTGFLAPTVAFDAAASGVNPDPNMLFANFRISGSGPSTVIWVGNKDWYGDGEWYLTTPNGLVYGLSGPGYLPYPGSFFGGGNSSIVPDPAHPTDNVLYDTGYPSTSNGVDSTIKPRRQLSGHGNFALDTFAPEQVASNTISNSTDVIYRTMFLTDVQTLPGLDYVVAYSTPSYNTYQTAYPADTSGNYNGGDGSVSNALRGASSTMPNYQPGWLAVHSQTNGQVQGLHRLDVTEALTLIPGYPFPAPHADTAFGFGQDQIPQGGIELYPVLDSAGHTVGSEILWWSSTYGFGRFYIDTEPVASVLKATPVASGLLVLQWNGAGILQSASTVTGPYADVVGARSGYACAGSAVRFFRLRLQ